jgi:ABC-type oligopeptide transport system substrate-binding subunit
MKKTHKLLFILFVFILALGLLLLGCCHLSLKNFNRSEGVESLSVPLKKDIENFNITNACENLAKHGYHPEIYGKNAFSDWAITTIWTIADDTPYTERYGNNISITLYGFNSSSTPPKSFMYATFSPCCTSPDPQKKIKDKDYAKQAIYEIAEILGVELDWEKHVYVIAWMSMTSEGYYEEK